ncbi:MAG: hypothetical protein ACP5GR_03515 [Thermoplasmata archaeon]|jgi:hypothetical protein
MKILVKGSNFPSAGFINFLKNHYQIDFYELPEYHYDFYYPYFHGKKENMSTIFDEYFQYDKKACKKGKNNVKFYCSRKIYLENILEKYNINHVENPDESKYDIIFESSIPNELSDTYYFEGMLNEKRDILADFRGQYNFFYTPQGTFFNIESKELLFSKSIFLRKVNTRNANIPLVRIEKNRIYYSPAMFKDLYPGYVLGLLTASYISSSALHYSCYSFKNYIF